MTRQYINAISATGGVAYTLFLAITAHMHLHNTVTLEPPNWCTIDDMLSSNNQTECICAGVSELQYQIQVSSAAIWIVFITVVTVQALPFWMARELWVSRCPSDKHEILLPVIYHWPCCPSNSDMSDHKLINDVVHDPFSQHKNQGCMCYQPAPAEWIVDWDVFTLLSLISSMLCTSAEVAIALFVMVDCYTLELYNNINGLGGIMIICSICTLMYVLIIGCGAFERCMRLAESNSCSKYISVCVFGLICAVIGTGAHFQIQSLVNNIQDLYKFGLAFISLISGWSRTLALVFNYDRCCITGYYPFGCWRHLKPITLQDPEPFLRV
jgi:hypothetical protein